MKFGLWFGGAVLALGLATAPFAAMPARANPESTAQPLQLAQNDHQSNRHNARNHRRNRHNARINRRNRHNAQINRRHRRNARNHRRNVQNYNSNPNAWRERYPHAVASRPHWSRGDRLYSSYRQPQYYVTDYRRYHLRRPPHGYRWTRVNNDFILVAISSGIIADVMMNAMAH